MNRRSLVTSLVAGVAGATASKAALNSQGPLPFNLDYLFSITLFVMPEVFGPVPEGIRVNLQSQGGTLDGPAVTGQVRPTGADYILVRPDGIASLDVRLTFATADGALIYATYTGVGELGLDGFTRFATGDVGGVIQLRSAPRFATAHPTYLYLNRLQCIGVGQGDLQTGKVNWDFYALR